LGLEDKLIKYIPEAHNNGKEDITIKNLLLHNAGLAPDYPFPDDSKYNVNITKDVLLDWTYNCELAYPIGT
jgi:CubicO group peptidase (beta-lactamase class C family)